MTAAPGMHWARAQRTCGARAASSFCGSSPSASGGKPMVPEAHEVVQEAVDGLRVASSIDWQHWVAKGGQPPVILDTPAVPKSRSGCRGIGSRQLADRGRSIEPRAVRPVARCTRCVQRPRCGSAHTHDLLRSDALADGRVSDMPKRAQSSFRNSA